MRPTVVVVAILIVGLSGCATGSMPQAPATAGTLAQDREFCEREAQAALYPSALAMPTPTNQTYPWTVGRRWPQNAPAERLRERDIFESCMAQRGHPAAER